MASNPYGNGGGGVEEPPGASGGGTANVEDVDRLPDVGVNCDSLTCIVTTLCCPLVFAGSWFEVQNNQEIILTKWGAYVETLKEPGLQYRNCVGLTATTTVTKEVAIDLPNMRMTDLHGVPIVASGIVTYRIQNAKYAVLLCEDASNQLAIMARSNLKRICSRYPYESNDGSASLKSDPQGVISREFVNMLQTNVENTGAFVSSFKFNEISYAPEIAAGMLQRQQASATIQARQIIVDGAVDIATRAIARLEENGTSMSSEDKAQLVSNIMTVIVSDSNVQPAVMLY